MTGSPPFPGFRPSILQTYFSLNVLGITAWLLFYRKKFTYYFQQQGISFTVTIGDIFAFTDGAAISFSDTF